MKRTLVALVLALTASGCALNGGIIGAPVVYPKPLEVHTCVPGATVWVDGALLPSVPQKITADANGVAAMPGIPGAAAAFNLHATAPGLTEYGAVITTKAQPGERIIVYLGSCTQ